MRVAYLRAHGPYKTSFASAWEKFGAWLHGRGFTGAGLRKYNIALDNPDVTAPDKLRGDVCIEVDDAFQPEGEVGVQIIPGGLYAVASHVGPWTLVGLAWHWLFNVWLPRSGKHFRLAPAYDQFRCGAETPLEDWVVEIHVPVELPTR